MDNKTNKHTDKEIVLRIFDLMFEAEVQSEEDADRYLREMGIDPDALAKEGMAVINKCKGYLRRSNAKKAMEFFKGLLEKLRTTTSTSNKRTVILDSFTSFNPQEAPAFHRRLEKLTDTDIASLDNEAKLLELWSDFLSDKDEKS